MFKFFKVGGPDGQFVNQTITALPAGNYNWSFYSQWGDVGHANGPTGTAPGNLPSWSAEGDNQPKFTILVQDADGAWVADQATVMTEPTTALTWVQDSGTWTNTETRDVRIKFAKNGGTAAGGGSNTDKLMYIDDASLTYASALEATSDCEYSISLSDSYGDGWGSNAIDVSVGGVVVLDDLTLTSNGPTSGEGPESTSFGVNEGDVISVFFVDGGSWSGECSYVITDSYGNIVASESGAGGASTAEGPADSTFTATCVEDLSSSLAVTATTGVASATFSFDIANFVVGDTDGVDGHIHYSLNGGNTVMVYSSDDLTLSDLPDGDHTIVFSLVNSDHSPLDPAVEATVEFSTFDGSYDCGDTQSYTYENGSGGGSGFAGSFTEPNESELIFTVTPDAGENVTLVIGGETENNWDWIYVTDEAGTVVYGPATGPQDVTVTTTGAANVYVSADSSVTKTLTFAITCAAEETPALSLQGIIDFSLPGKYMKGIHVKASADIADLSIYSVEPYASGDRLTPSAVYTLSGSASEGDDLLFWMSNADDAANIYMNASGIFDVVVEESEWNGYNGDDPITLSMNGDVIETYGELGVDGTGEAWEYLDTWAYKVDGAWTHGVVNCTDGSYYTWDSGCVYPLADGQQATGASTDLVTAFSEDMNVVPSGGFWYNETEAPIERKTASNVPGSDTSAMQYIDSGEFSYSNMQIQFTSKVDMNSMNTFTMDVYVDGTTTTGDAPVNLALKLQDASEDTPWTNQNVVVQDITVDTWTTLTFEFNDSASMSRDDVDRVVVQFNGEGNNDQVTAYMKNVVGSFTEPVATETTAVTFNVDMSQYGLADGDTVHVNGEFTGWCGDCGYNVMSDDDGDGVYSLTLELEEGSYFWKFTVNGWNAQESFSEGIDGCTADNNGNFDRQVVVGAEAISLSYCWNSCEAAGSCTPVEPILMPIDHENESVNYAWNDFGGAATSVIANPDASGINTSANVAQSIKTAGSETWAGTFIVLDEQLDFSNVTTLAVDVWTPDGGELVNLKVENAADGNIVIELNQPTTVAAGWETLYYDLSGGDLSQVYDKIVFFFDFNVGGDDTAYYFDNIRLEAASTVGIDPGCNDFDSGTEGWTVVDSAGNESNWVLDETLQGGANGSVYSMGHGYEPSTTAYNDWLVSPAYNTTGLSAPTLSYYEHLNWSGDAFQHNVLYSTDYDGDVNTATWNFINAEIGTDAEDTWTQRVFALPSAENIVIAFQYVATYGADWNIDDVCVQEDTLSTVDATALDMRIYPNPSNGSYVTIQTPVNGVKYVEVFDITGKRLINTSLSADTLDVSSMSSGMYLVKVTVEGQSKTSKLIIR